MRNNRFAAGLALILALASSCAIAQQKSVRVLAGFAAGGTLDAMTRLFADALRVNLGQPMIVEIRAGASGLLAIEALRAAPADGSVLMTAASGTTMLLPNTYKNPPFDPTRDFIPVAQMGQVDFVLTVNAEVPAKTAVEFAALARSVPKYRTIGTPPRSNPHFLAMLFARAANVEVVHVPYKGSGPALTDLIGGQIAAAFLTVGEAQEMDRAGKVRILASSGARRSTLLPNVPTLRESGFDVEGSSWYAFFAPVGTPDPVVERLSMAIVEVAGSADLRARLIRAGIEPAGLPQKELAAKVRLEYEQIGNALRAAGFKQEMSF